MKQSIQCDTFRSICRTEVFWLHGFSASCAFADDACASEEGPVEDEEALLFREKGRGEGPRLLGRGQTDCAPK